jgi:hypothetical protein
MNAKKKALLKKEQDSHLREDAKVVSENESMRLKVKEKLKDFKLTEKSAQTDAYLKKPRLNEGKPKSVVTVHRSDDTEEQVDPLSLKEIILQSDNIKKITIEKVGVEDAKRVSFHFDDPKLKEKGERVVIKGESLRKLIEKRSKENKSKLKKNISNVGKKSEEQRQIPSKDNLKLIQGEKSEFADFDTVEELYESKRSGLRIRFPNEFKSENSVKKDDDVIFAAMSEDDQQAHELLESLDKQDTDSNFIKSKDQVEDASFMESNDSFRDPTINESEGDEIESILGDDISDEDEYPSIESETESIDNESIEANESETVGTTGFKLIKQQDQVEEFVLVDEDDEESEPLDSEISHEEYEDDVGGITDDNYLKEVIRKDEESEPTDEAPVLKTIKYKAQILSKQKNLAHNGYYYKAVDHVELFKTGTSYLEDFKNGVRSFAFSSLGVTDARQKSIFGICSFFNYHTEVKTLIVAEDFKKSFFSFYVKDLKPKIKPIYKDGETYQIYSGPGFDVLDFYEVKKVYSKVPHYDYEEFLRELTNKYDLVLWDLPEMEILDANKEIYFPVIRMLDNVSLIVRSKETNLFQIRSLADYYSKYQVDIKGILFDNKKKKLPNKKGGS